MRPGGRFGASCIHLPNGFSSVPSSGGRPAPERQCTGIVESAVFPVGSGHSPLSFHYGPLHSGMGMPGCGPSRRLGDAPCCLYSASHFTSVAALRRLLHGSRAEGRPDSGTSCPPHRLRPLPLRWGLCGGPSWRHGRRLGRSMVGSGRASSHARNSSRGGLVPGSLLQQHCGVLRVPRMPPQSFAGAQVPAPRLRARFHARCDVHAGQLGLPPRPPPCPPSGMPRSGGSPYFSRLSLDNSACLPRVQYRCRPARG